MPLNGLKKSFVADLGQKKRGGACAHGKQQQTAQSKGKCKRRTAAEEIFCLWLEYMPGKSVTDNEKIAVEMNGCLWLSGGTGAERYQSGIVLKRGDIGEICRPLLEKLRDFLVLAIVENNFFENRRSFLRSGQLRGMLSGTERVFDPGFVGYSGKFLSAKLWHCGYCNP